MENRHIGIIVVIVLVIVGGWYLLSVKPAQAPAISTPTAQEGAAGTLPAGSGDTTVVYTDQGFAPADVTVAPGMKVVFVNQSSGGMWVASAVHPSHAVYSGTTLSQHCPDTSNTAFDSCAAVASGGTYSFTFDKVGTWKYHDHLNASKTGSVTVTAAQ
jgi:plastocyanin